MKITTFLLLIGCLHASASTYGQKVSLSERNVSLEQIFSLLKKQTGYDFLYGAGLRADVKKVNIEAKNLELAAVLESIFSDQPFSYAISDKTVVIKSKSSNDIQQRTIQGKVLDENRQPLQSASVRVEGTNQSTQTDLFGMFTLTDVPQDDTIHITYMGYDTRNIKVSNIRGFLEVILRMSENKLDEANVLSTGYFRLPKERATGSFDHIDNELFNRNVGPDVITRLKGVTVSTIFGDPSQTPRYTLPAGNVAAGVRKVNALNNLQIRGISSLTTATSFNAGTPGQFPLIILDNFPYEGDVNNINPNDVESVTVLKDAAASSIWGSRSSSGVIVITTKKGQLDQPIRISVNSNVTVRGRPDLFYGPATTMNSSDFIDIEKYNFEQGTYNRYLRDQIYTSITPVVDLLFQQRALPITDIAGRAAIDAKIDAYRNYDRRKDISKYLYRNAVLQQYSMNFSGGGRQFNYFFSGGYDYNTDSEINVYYRRKNLRSSMTFKPLKNLEFNTDIYFTNALYHAPSAGSIAGGNSRIINMLPNDPYLRLADENGNALEVINPTARIAVRNHRYRHTAGNGRLLDWRFFPLNDIDSNYGESNSQNVLMNFGVNYTIIPSLRASINYQYSKNIDEQSQFINRSNYQLRDLINTLAKYDKDDPGGDVDFQIPIGDLIANRTVPRVSNTWRGQLTFDHTFNQIHEVNAVFGGERSEAKINGGPYLAELLGYSADPMTFVPFPYGKELAILNDQGTFAFSYPTYLQTSFVNRTTSAFMNASYSYDKRYILTVSGRNDAGNIYGITASNRIKPSWSVGGAWNVNNENFFKFDLLQSLKLRVTYGYMGNVVNTVAAYPTIAYSLIPNDDTKLNYATINTPPNPNLSPERTGMLNVGIDFALKGNRFSGSLEWYDKRTTGLIAPTPIDISTGFSSMMRNSAHLKGNGFEVNLQSINLQSSNFRWSTNLLLSYTRNVVTKYLLEVRDEPSSYVSNSSGSIPQLNYRAGQAPFTLYTYRFAGLDPQTGDPLGYDQNDNISKNYGDLLNVKVKDLQNHGSIIPLYYGAFRNTVQWKSFSLSANILYKFKYKMKRQYDSPSGLFTSQAGPLLLYAERWQKPGDELLTNIPSIRLGDQNFQKDSFYASSSALVFRGDHIRLEDIRLDYQIPKSGKVLRSLQVYCNISNLGILWRANKFGIDPDSFMQPPAPRMITVGFNASF